jgi:hypothetical protein
MAARRAFLSAAVIALRVVIAPAACSGSDAVIFTNSMRAANAALDPPVMRAVDGIPGWKRQGPPESFNKEGLYGHIDGGAEMVLQYGFRELSVFKFKPAAAPDGSKEVSLEIYRMASGEAAFGLYSTKPREAKRLAGRRGGNWPGPGQANRQGEHCQYPGPRVHGPRSGSSPRRAEGPGPGDRSPRDGRCRARA